jgi:RecA/RadA recombinase
MAKKQQQKMNFSEIGDIFQTMSKKTALVIEDEEKPKKFISTGNYVFNALLSKNIRKGGISDNRLTVLAGPPGCGKSYMCYNVARNAQKDGYNVIYIDTEYSIELDELKRFGINTNKDKFLLVRNNKVEELKITLAKLLKDLKEKKQEGFDIGKNIIILDSIGQLASNKEIEDALDGKIKVDMSRAKGLKSLFRVITADLGYLDIPMLSTNHIYMSQDLFPQTIMGGGEGVMYSASTVIFMSTAKLDDKSGDFSFGEKTDYVQDTGQDGIKVTARAKKNRLAKPMKIKFDINFDEGTNPYKGLEAFCNEENYEKVGICKGKKDSKGNFVPGGTKYYVRHLDKTFYPKDLFNSEVFNEKVLDSLEPIIEKHFSYSSYKEQEEAYSKQEKELEKQVEKAVSNSTSKKNK